MRVLWTCVLLLLSAVPSQAQTVLNPVPANQPLTASWNANPASEGVTAYRCYIDKVKIGADIPATSALVCAVPAQAVGQHNFEVSAVNAFGEGARASLTVTAGTPPSGPTNLRIVVQIAVQQSGEVTLLAASVSNDGVRP